MYHPPSKRRQFLQRVAVYIVMTLSVATLVIALVFVMLGYQLNKSDGKIEQGGLVQFGTKPGGATVTIDDAKLGTNTPSKTTATSGQHFVSMALPGYNSWQKSVNVVAGSVLWLNYARLVPNDLTPRNVADFSSITSTVASPDGKWFALQDVSAAASLKLADLSGDKVAMKTLAFPAASFTAPQPASPPQSFSVVSWDPSSRFVLVKHTYDTDKIEWLIVDTQDVNATKNVTKMLDINATKLEFSNSDSRILYGLIGGDLKKINLDAVTLSGPLVRNVVEFALYNRSTLTYVTQVAADTKQRSVGYYDDGADKPRVLRSYSDNGTSPLHLAFGKYYGETYEAISYGETVEILKGSLPRSDSSDTSSLKAVATMTIPHGANHLSILTDGRFIVAQHDNAYSIYDLELSKMTTTTLKAASTPTEELKWIDGYSIWNDLTGTVRLYEFDGTNQHDIMPVVPGFSVTLSPSGRYMYGINKDDKGVYHLQRVQMILN